MAEVPISGFLPPQPQQSLDQYLEVWEERWNKRVDQDVSILGDGLGKVLAEAQVSAKNGYVVSFQRRDDGSLSLPFA